MRRKFKLDEIFMLDLDDDVLSRFRSVRGDKRGLEVSSIKKLIKAKKLSFFVGLTEDNPVLIVRVKGGLK